MGRRQTTAAVSLELEGFRYGSAPADALHGISLQLPPGSLTVVRGASGAGKTTLGMILAGMLPRPGMDTMTGHLELAGTRIGYTPEHTPRIDPAGWATQVGLLPQEAGHYLSGIRETVAEELAFTLENAGVPAPDMAHRVERIARDFDLEHLLQRDPARLSGGQQRLVALAALAVNESKVLVLDEPLAGLDARATALVLDFMDRLRRRGCTLLVLACTTGVLDPDLVLDLEDGTLHASPGGDAPYPVTKRGSVTPDAPVLLEFRDADLGYSSGTSVLKDFELSVRAGECVGLSGPNGAGKSTVLKAAAGLLDCRSGSLRATDTGLLLQNPTDQLFERTVLREVSFGLTKRGQLRQQVPQVLEQLGLADVAESHPYELPASARRLVALATVLVREPKVLLLDEPTEALDQEGIIRLLQVIDGILEVGGAVLFTCHDWRFMEATAHRVQHLGGNGPRGRDRSPTTG
ncbi:ATP-binding cassette domain-containing protein [Glutamicibacter sp. MNS18]|uniref:ABC transporter ATP-binding protein n=1 Tax=Glutamicibacter sp. MNS18 TaxID=2989817 RepID=UPI002235BB96|nr:ATP-binding cassette domain-containing protein [Glutamicibacter sp. MNS18]MCW4466806.1 ATP-binding cassette domain-containing protein [Glutamicibacter sp. MNS18]